MMIAQAHAHILRVASPVDGPVTVTMDFFGSELTVGVSGETLTALEGRWRTGRSLDATVTISLPEDS